MEPDLYPFMTMEWDYKNRAVTLSILRYVKEALLEFEYATREMKWILPSPYKLQQYRKKIQLAKVDKIEPMRDN